MCLTIPLAKEVELIFSFSARPLLRLVKRHDYLLRTSEEPYPVLQMPRNSPVWKSFFSCKKILNVLVPNLRKKT